MDFLFPDRNCNPFSSGSTGKLLRHIKFHLLQTSNGRQCRKLLHKRELKKKAIHPSVPLVMPLPDRKSKTVHNLKYKHFKESLN